MSLVEIATIEAGTSILFLGAGFSADATSVTDKEIKDVSGLITDLLSQIGISSAEGYDLDSAAEEFQLQKGDQATALALHSNFRSKQVTHSQRIVVTQPWYRIYTSNYDDVVERICTEEYKPITTKEVNDKVEAPISNTTQLVHIYGNITRSSANEFKQTFLLTERQRDNSPFFTSAWMRRFHDDILTASSIVFVGFSLTDVDIRRLLGSVPSTVSSKIHFIARNSTKRPVLNRMKRFGIVHTIGVDGFATHLGVKRAGAPVKYHHEIPPYLRELAFNPQVEAHISSRDVDNLIVSGDISIEKIAESDIVGSASSYTMQRNPLAYERAFKNSSSSKPILVHGDIGNGKTIFAYQVGYYFSQRDYRVFRVQREPENVGDILAFLQSSIEKTLIIFDDLMHFKTLPSSIIRMNHPNLVVLATVRTIVLETSSERVRTYLGGATAIEVDLNTPLRPETINWVRYLDTNGLWGQKADLTPNEKLSLVEHDCGRQLRDLVLSLYKTGSLHNKVEQLLINSQELDDKTKALIAISALLSYADLEQSSQFIVLSDLVSYSGALEEFRSALREKELSSLIRIDTVDVIVRSPALAQFLLSRIFSLDALLSIVTESLKRLDKFYVDEMEFLNLGRALLKFSLYGGLINAKHDNKLIEKFYDNCRTLSFASGDPLFWVQRSICNMHNKQFDVSYRFVETAYSLARKRNGFDPYQIETHHARLMLIESRDEGASPNGERELRAVSILQSILSRKSDDLYHPLSVMRILAEITENQQLAFSKNQRAAMKTAIDQAVKSIKAFKRTDRFRNLPELERRLMSSSASLR